MSNTPADLVALRVVVARLSMSLEELYGLSWLSATERDEVNCLAVALAAWHQVVRRRVIGE